MATEIAGLPVKTEPAGLTAVLKAVAVIEGLNEAGERVIRQVITDGITITDAIGMHTAAAAMYEKALPASST